MASSSYTSAFESPSSASSPCSSYYISQNSDSYSYSSSCESRNSDLYSHSSSSSSKSRNSELSSHSSSRKSLNSDLSSHYSSHKSRNSDLSSHSSYISHNSYSSSSASSFSSSSSSSSWKYDVFLSFRGKDTRNNFTDHLYAALRQKGFDTFRDDDELKRGRRISLELLESIEESRISIIVLSKYYAFSTWCLDELEKIVECMEKLEQTVLPVFYDVEPTDVRNQTGNFKLAFHEHEKRFKKNKEKVQRWRAALTKVGNLSGWHLQNRSETQLIRKIVREVWNISNQGNHNVSGDFVGVDSCLQELNKFLQAGRDEVCLIGIWGMCGIGKTTIARALYDKLSKEYQDGCFLANVKDIYKQNGVVKLQQKLLSKILGERNLQIFDHIEGIRLIRKRLRRKKVLLVIDDVDELNQLQMLAGKHSWFGSGSVVVITTRDKNILTNHAVNNIYKVNVLNYDEALQLLHMKAFKSNKPSKGHVILLKHVVNYAKGLPLALDVLGSLLCDKSVELWKHVLDMLEECPYEEIFKILRISYDGLGELEKKIFLDIACFFNGEDKDRVVDILHSCGFHPHVGIKRLIDKSLIRISNENELQMHDLLQDVAQQIVREKHPDEPWRWSRLWSRNDADKIFTKNMGTKSVEGIVLHDSEKEISCINGKIFSTMSNLRILKICNIKSVHGLKSLSNALRVLEWHDYPLQSLPSTFRANKLVELKMYDGKMEYLWKGIKTFEMLKTIKICYSSLIEAPDFSRILNLEILNFEDCTQLRRIHKSVAYLEKLIELVLRNCKKLASLPRRVSGMNSLKIFDLHGCSRLNKLPDDIGKLENLEVLEVGDTAIRRFPSSIERLRKLKELSLCGFIRFSIPPLEGFHSLTMINLSYCNLQNLPTSLGSLRSLEILNLSGNKFASLPASFKQLYNLKLLQLRECKRLKSLTNIPQNTLNCTIDVGDCPSLTTICSTYSFKRMAKERWALTCANCFKLVEFEKQNSMYRWMEKLLKVWLQGRPQFECQIMIPGRFFPKWFRLQTYNDSIIIKLPHHWNNDEFLGFLLCAVVKPQTSRPPETGVQCRFILSTGSAIRRDFSFNIPVNNIASSHFCLGYNSCYMMNLDKELFPETYAQLKWTNKESCTVERCGIRLLYKQDMENLQVLNNIGKLYHPEDDDEVSMCLDEYCSRDPDEYANCGLNDLYEEQACNIM